MYIQAATNPCCCWRSAGLVVICASHQDLRISWILRHEREIAISAGKSLDSMPLWASATYNSRIGEAKCFGPWCSEDSSNRLSSSLRSNFLSPGLITPSRCFGATNQLDRMPLRRGFQAYQFFVVSLGASLRASLMQESS